MISEFAFVDKGATIGKNVTIEPFAYIASDVVIGDDCVIKAHASVLSGTRMGRGNRIHQGVVLGAEPQDFSYKKGEESGVVLGEENEIRENVVIARSSIKGGYTKIGNHCHLMEGVHLCHDVELADYVVIGLKSILTGNCKVDQCSILSNSVILHQNVHVGQWSLVQSGTRLAKDVPPFIVVSGNPASYHGVNQVVLKNNDMHKLTDKILRGIISAYLIIYQGGASVEDSLKRIHDQIPKTDEIDIITDFIKKSKGIL